MKINKKSITKVVLQLKCENKYVYFNKERTSLKIFGKEFFISESGMYSLSDGKRLSEEFYYVENGKIFYKPHIEIYSTNGYKDLFFENELLCQNFYNELTKENFI